MKIAKIVALAGLLVGFTTVKAAAPSPPVVSSVFVPGDTLGYTVTWPAVSAATTYDFTVSVAATNGTWSAIFGSTGVGALPASGNTAFPGPVGLKLSAMPWDSATFTFAYRARHVPARNSSDTSAFASFTWKVARHLGAPVAPTVTPDSATVKVTAAPLFVKPPTFALLVATYGVGPSLDSASCVTQLRLPGQHWGRGTSGPGGCVDQWGGIVPLPLRDSVRFVLGHRLVPLDTLGRYGEQASLLADTVP